MHLSGMSVVNYRNFANAHLLFNKGVNTLIGENASGKSNLFRAMRLLIDESLMRSAFRLNEGDFHRGLGNWRGHWIIISLEFAEISDDETVQALFVHGTGQVASTPVDKATYNLIFRPKSPVRLKLASLADGDRLGLEHILEGVTIDDYETFFTGRSTADFNDPEVYKTVVGDFENVVFQDQIEFASVGAKLPGVLSMYREVSVTFVQALRDVVDEFRSNRTNPLFALLKNKSGELDSTTFAPITEMVDDLNASIQELQEVQNVRSDVLETVRATAGQAFSPASLSIRSDLPAEAEKLFQSLKLFVGEVGDDFEGGVSELSLGGANLIYLTLKLLEFKYQTARRALASFLLIEEPEAHLHTHIQKTLFDRIGFPDTQIIYSTHSPQISEVSNVANMNVLSRRGVACEAYQPSNGLTDTETAATSRYLDAIRSNLLFAKSVVLVEGDAEELLLPALVKAVLGLSLDELGVSLVNIRSTGFENVARLFADERIRKRCAIVTDLDKAFIDITPDALDEPAVARRKAAAERSQLSGLARQERLATFSRGNVWLQVFLAPHTFEVDLAMANPGLFIEALPAVVGEGTLRTTAREQLGSGQIGEVGTRALRMAKANGKGWFALSLGHLVKSDVTIPDYLAAALVFAHGPFSSDVLADVLAHRLERLRVDGADADAEMTVQSWIAGLRGRLVLPENVRDGYRSLFPNDALSQTSLLGFW